MTVAAAFWPRGFALDRTLPAGQARLFRIEPNTQLLGHCHWQPSRPVGPTLLLVHGLEGSSNSPYILGTAAKGWREGFQVVRLNQRNCGGTEALTPTLYNSGRSEDIGRVLDLLSEEGCSPICLVGFSMGGNLVLKLAGDRRVGLQEQVRAVVAVSPALDLAACVRRLEAPANQFYHWYFLRSLRRRLRRKAELFPERYDLSGLRDIRTVRNFDNTYTAPDAGYGSAEEYYERASALRVVAEITVPTLVVVAQDDPLVPHSSFLTPALTRNHLIRLLAPRWGGHCGFLAWPREGETCYWAEHRAVEFCAQAAGLLEPE